MLKIFTNLFYALNLTSRRFLNTYVLEDELLLLYGDNFGFYISMMYKKFKKKHYYLIIITEHM